MSHEALLLPPGTEPPADSMDMTFVPDSISPSQTSITSLKRRASSSPEDAESSTSHKKLKEEMPSEVSATPETPISGQVLADELEQELQCGCCAALVYRPVIVSPCQHFFCGSCIVLWVKNGGTSCPACRGISIAVTPSRALQTMADLLVRFAPSKARTSNERLQADDIYKAGASLRIPPPRVLSPEPSIPQANPNYVQPCPHCAIDNQWGWRCPQPIADPETDPDSAWHNDDGNPPGHAYCGHCENILALQAPTTSKCDFCQVSFCGVSVPGRCVAAPLLTQHLHMLSDIGDMIQFTDIYEVFDSNAVEVDILIDYMTAQNLSPRHIYREVIGMILSTPQGFQPLLEAEVFVDVHRVAGGPEPDLSAPRNKVCRICATEILLWGLRAWWILERKKGLLEESALKRPDCPEGRACSRQRDHVHAKEFNHIIMPRELEQPTASTAVQTVPSQPSHPQTTPLSDPEDHTEPYIRNSMSLSGIADPERIQVVSPIGDRSDPLMEAGPSSTTYQTPMPREHILADLAEAAAMIKDSMSSFVAPLDKPGFSSTYPGDIPIASSQEVVERML